MTQRLYEIQVLMFIKNFFWNTVVFIHYTLSMTVLSYTIEGFNRQHTAHKASNIYYLALHRSFQTPKLECLRRLQERHEASEAPFPRSRIR